MIRGLRRHTGGFTILESIIVLTVMVALLGSALLLFQQRVPRTQFQKSLNELTTQISDVVNQVASGNYPTSNGITCSTASGEPVLSSGSQEQGTNSNCIFIGQAVQFGLQNGASGTCSQASPNDKCDTLRIYTVFGSRLDSTGGSVAKNITQAQARVDDALASTTYTTGYGLYVTKVKVNDGISDTYGGVAYTQSFGGTSLVDNQLSGAQQVDLIPLRGTDIGMTEVDYANASMNALLTPKNPQGGVLVCLKSATTDQYAVLILGAGGNASSVEQKILSRTEWASLCA